MSQLPEMSLRRLLALIAIALAGSGCVSGRACDWECNAEAYMEAERDGSASGDAQERTDRALKARRAAEAALWAACVPPAAGVVRDVENGTAIERRRAITLALARGYDVPELLVAVLRGYPSEEDALARIRSLQVLILARRTSLESVPSAEFFVMRAESTPSVMAAAINVARRIPEDVAVPLLSEYMSRGPRWILIAAYGVANGLGFADKVRADLTRRGAREVLDVISQWEKTGETPWEQGEQRPDRR